MNDRLARAALAALRNAHAPHSGFRVGAAVLSADGTIFSGCNIENASYGLTLCAERVAIFKAVSEGHRRLVRICVAAETEVLTTPCGACRQIIWEFCGDVEVDLVNDRGSMETVRSGDLLPRAFDDSQLEQGGN